MDAIDILIKVRKIVHSINLESKRVQKELGISIPQLLCLKHLAASDGFISTHGELMKTLSLNSSTVTGIINRLEQKGFVARLPKMQDKRITQIILTSKGHATLNEQPKVLHNQLLRNIEKLDEGSKQIINTALDMIITSMLIKDFDAASTALEDTFEEPEKNYPSN